MTWDKFRRPAALDADAPAFEPRRGDRTVTLPSGPEALRPPAEGQSVAGPAMPAAVRRRVELARGRLRSARLPDDSSLPERMAEMGRGRDTAGFIDAFFAELMSDPRGDALVEARAILNELGRDPETARIVQERLGPDAVARVIAAGAKKAGRG